MSRLLARGFLFALAAGSVATAAASPVHGVSKGHYLAIAADCEACHSAPGGKPFAGGYGIATPLGTIYSTNITPSLRTGIGAYSEADFARAIREGIAPSGRHLYPAMPYPAYAALTDADVAALYAYFHDEVAPVEQADRPDDLPFPFNIRAGMALWNVLYLDHARFAAVPGEAPVGARGRYLADALEHCGTCHTPRTLLMGPKASEALAGAPVGAWYAPDVTPDRKGGIGDWSDGDIARYLRTGSVPGKAQAGGPMAEVVSNSTQFLSDDDIKALVAYLRGVQARPGIDRAPRAGFSSRRDGETALRGDRAASDRGWRLYSGSCAACHQADGGGTDRYPSLTHNTATGSVNPTNLVSTILMGLDRPVDGHHAYMPAFGPTAAWTSRLSDRDIADVANYVLSHFGNPEAHVSERDVTRLRENRTTSVAARALPYAAALAVAVSLAGIVLLRRRRANGGPV